MISDHYIGPLCAPQYAARFHCEQDLALLPLLHAWAEWAKTSGARGNYWAGKHFDNLTLGIQAVRNGLGIINDTALSGTAGVRHRHTDCATGGLCVCHLDDD